MLYNRFIFSALALFLYFGTIQANDTAPNRVKASLNEATVFFNGAELAHKASASVVKGVNDVWISELSPNIDVNSLRIKTTKGVIVASYEFSLDYITQKQVSSLEKNLKDSVKYYERKIKEYEINEKTNEDLLDLLEKNKSIGGTQTGLSVSELAKMVEFYKMQSNSLNQAQSDLEEKKEKAEQALSRVRAQLNQESAKNTKTTGVLKLNLTSPLATNTEFAITYFTKKANWIPYYDINVPGGSANIQIASKAKVAQTTGLDWNKVKLALSTATPSANKEAPLFDAWFLDFQESLRIRGISSTNRLSQNSFSYATQSIPDVLESKASGVQILGKEKLAQPLYIVNGELVDGFPSDLDESMIQDMQVLKDANATSLYGSRASNGVVLITTKALNDFVDRTDGELNAVYNIDLPYTILGNGKVQNIDLQSHAVSAEIKHYTVPKLEQEVFVLAEVADWQKLGLLSGKANITYDGTYVGETVINATSTAKKLTLTLGTDKRVSVKREKLQDFSSQKFLGKDTQKDFTYKITVKNNQNRPVKMVLKDQYPLSKQKDIQVELLKETTAATFNNEDVGVLSWEFELGAGETKEFKVAYRVKYPKDRPINL